MLTGLTPPDTNDIIAGIRSAPLPTHGVNPLVSLQVSQAVERAMQFNRTARPASVAEFQAALFPPPAPSPAPTPPAIYTATTVQAPAQPPMIPPPTAVPGTKTRPAWLGWAIGLAVLGVIVAAFIIGRGMSGDGDNQRTATALAEMANKLTPATATRTPRPEATVTTRLTSTLSPATLTPTFIVVPDTPTATLPLEPTLGIGSTKVSVKDGMVMVYVPEGSFLMGSKDDDTNASGDEKPQHEVYLDAYWIDQTEVTNDMYAKCVADGACQPPSPTSSSSRNAYYGEAQYADFPVIYVSWNDAEAYCRWAGRQLPSEAQWEKAAKGDDGRIYPWGDQQPTCDLANSHNESTGSRCVGDTSPYGALDMAGNVWEWVNDSYDSSYYSSSPSSNPIGPESGSSWVLRGGVWGYGWDYLRTAYRGYDFPDDRGTSLGFRCVSSSGK